MSYMKLISSLLIIGSLFISVHCNVLAPIIKSLNVNCDIKYKYATTLVSSRILNPANVSQEVNFRVTLPQEAFITRFVMVIKGEPYEAYIKEKEEAKKDYDAAVSAGQSAGHIFQTSSRYSKDFTVSVNVAAEEKAEFNVTYEELLTRKNGTYKTEINIEPHQIVPNLSIVVNIEDVLPIRNVKVPQFKMSNEIDQIDAENPNAKKEVISPTKVRVEWSPTKKEQKQLKPEGLNGQMIVEYDVDASNKTQQIIIDEDGYFVHILRNDLLPVLNKHVIFVLDVSGSMYGNKLEQMKQAMDKILSDLSKRDYFSIVLFSDAVAAWKKDGIDMGLLTYSYYTNEPKNVPVVEENIIPATEDNVKNAVNFTKSLGTYGGTNINGGLRAGIDIAKLGQKKFHNDANQVEPMIIFLTDGEPNTEEPDPEKIIENVGKRNTEKFTIFSLSFGFDADLNFLKKLSLMNKGFSRRIYEGSDAAMQLNNFFKEVASPVMSDVKFDYLPEKVESATPETKSLYSGSEILVIGKVKPNSTVSGVLSAMTTEGRKMFQIPIDYVFLPPIEHKPNQTKIGYLEKMWAYKTIKSLLDQNTVSENNTLKEKAKELALKYKFVTPLTSLVVVKPNVSSVVDDNQEDKKYPGGLGYAAYMAPQPNMAFGMRSKLMKRIISAPKYATYSNSVGYAKYPRFGAGGSFPGAGAGFSGPMLAVGAPGMPASAMAPMPFAPMIVGGQVPTRVQQHFYSTAMPAMTENFESSTHEDSNGSLISYTNVTWLNQTISDDGLFLQPPPEVDRNDVIALNETDVSTTRCSNGNPCRHFIFCSLDSFANNLQDYLPYKCHIEPRFLGVCCPF
ncbi:inter-alpha-trypsin inhibitor heavy chain H3 isoform X4 [Halyomorpha halys]|uniref:inter-alpha-trypsin inhibitor heavy chain H3 isoform X4 n=1 Tax=Halyomorpha halys TaxID=286706 RepID=UPI000D0C7602|nr:inter-alpha-trypsin inhibitor heavy chain H3-like isoform X4 [Halyomorpha halys]